MPQMELRRGKMVLRRGSDLAGQVLERADVLDTATQWMEAGATWLSVMDLDAEAGKAPQWGHLSRLLGLGMHVQFGGGIRSMVQVQKLLDLGVDRVVLGTQANRHPAWLKEVSGLFPAHVVMGLSTRAGAMQVEGGDVPLEGDAAALAERVDGMGLAALQWNDVNRRGTGAGPDLPEVTRWHAHAAHTPLLVHGGIHTLDHVRGLQDAGAAGAVLSTLPVMDLDAFAGILAEFPQETGRPLLQVLGHESGLEEE